MNIWPTVRAAPVAKNLLSGVPDCVDGHSINTIEDANCHARLRLQLHLQSDA
ncbi:MAG: hypothetical protein ABJQ70_19925 [Roseobacter sp.]